MDNLTEFRWEKLDKRCQKILLVMILKKDTMRFNELAKTLKKLGMEMSHPTLLDHLNHLVKERLVTRREEKAQYVTYRLNMNKIGESKKYLDRAVRIEKSWTKEKESLFSMLVDKQVEIVLQTLAVRKLYEIQARIALELDSKNLEKQIGVLFWTSSIVENVEFWLIQKAVEDQKYREELLKTINKWIGEKRENES